MCSKEYLISHVVQALSIIRQDSFSVLLHCTYSTLIKSTETFNKMTVEAFVM